MAKWRIEGYSGTEKIMCDDISGGLSEAEIERFLKCLVAKFLSIEEIRRSCLRKNMKGYIAFLEVKKNVGGHLMIGTDPHFIACWRKDL